MNESEFEPNIQTLDPTKLYTQETRVYKDGIKDADLSKPVNFGVDKNGIIYVTDGNHRAKKGLQEGKTILGRHISNGNFDVTTDEDFRLISELKIV